MKILFLLLSVVFMNPTFARAEKVVVEGVISYPFNAGKSYPAGVESVFADEKIVTVVFRPGVFSEDPMCFISAYRHPGCYLENVSYKSISITCGPDNHYPPNYYPSNFAFSCTGEKP